MDTADLLPLVDDLSSNVDDLQESLAPLLKTALSNSTSKLPLLDKAKELARVKEYFAKIKTAETAGNKRTTTLDKEAANRFIKHGLAGNEKHDRERQDRIAREKAGAKRKFDQIQVGTHTRFDGSAKRIKATEVEQDSTAEGSGDITPRLNGAGASTATMDVDVAESEALEKKARAERKAAKRQRREERRAAKIRSGDGQSHSGEPDGNNSPPQNPDMHDNDDVQEIQNASRTTAEALESLLQSSPLPEEENTPKKKKTKRKSKSQKLQDDIADEMK